MSTESDIALLLEEEKQARKLAEDALANLQLAVDALKEKEPDNKEQKENIFKLHTREIHSLALFSVENPNPILRISLEGNVLFQNPAAHFINEFEYDRNIYKQPDFWKFLSQLIFPETERLSIEVKTGSTTFLFDCLVLKEKGYIDVFGQDISKEKIAEAREKVAELRWRFAIEGQAGGIWEYNLQTMAIEYSLQYRSMLGYSFEEFAKDAVSYQSLVHPKDVKAFRNITELYKAGRIDSHMLEYRVLCKDQTYKWVMDRGQLITRTEDGRPEIIMGINTDITKRKQEEEILYETEQRWKLALEGSDHGVWEYDHETKKLYTSDVCKDILGLKDDNPAIHTWRSLVYPEDIPALIKINRGYIKGSIDDHNVDYRILQPDGTYKWIHDKGMVIRRADNGRPVKFTGLMSDISVRKKIEEELKLSEEKYRGIIEGLNLGLLEVDNDDNILYVNQSFCAMSGFDHDELIGKKATDLFLKGLAIQSRQKQNELRKPGVPDVYEIAVKNKKKEDKWWLVSGTPLYDNRRNIIGSIGIHLDITRRKTLESKLIEAKQIAEESVKAKDIFMANMSHEIRTPMNAILGLSNLLKKTQLTPTQQSYVSSMQTATHNLLELINDILDFSKIEAGKVNIENIGFDLSSLLQDTLNFFAYKTEEKGLKLVYNRDNNLHKIFLGDPYKINQILTNLLSNAVKFTEKGTITIGCKVLVDYKDGQHVLISATDTGIGMDEQFLTQIFAKFAQEDESIARKYGGSGLGMSITKQLVDLMKGEIDIISKKGMGTTVNIILKLVKGTVADLPETEQPLTTEIDFENIKILLAEDNDMNRLVATSILEQHGARVDEAFNGKVAVEKAGSNDYDIILMDIRMPEMDGFEATRLIRSEVNKTVPIIALTAHALREEADRCLAAGMDDFLVKPYQEKGLINIIVKWLNKSNNSKKIYIKQREEGELYNLTNLKEISNNSKTFMAKMLNLFVESIPVSINQMEAALEQNDMLMLKDIAHTIKPVIDTMNISSQKEVIRKIEDLAGEGEKTAELEQLVTHFKESISEVVDKVKKDKIAFEQA